MNIVVLNIATFGLPQQRPYNSIRISKLVNEMEIFADKHLKQL